MNHMPKLSVIVVSFNSPTILDRCLTSLDKQSCQDAVEILVVGKWDFSADKYETVRQRFLKMRWLSAPAAYTVPQMRQLGMTESQGELIALLEDDCLVDERWYNALLAAHQEPYQAIGGAVEPTNYEKRLDWAVYFCEYARFMLPLPEQNVQALAGNNVSYKRSILSKLLADSSTAAHSQRARSETESSGFYDVFAHWALRQAGEPLKAESSIVVHQINRWGWSHILSVPFHHGRGFAAMRVAEAPLRRRLPFLLLAIALPLVIMGRVIKEVVGRKRYIRKLVLCLPWIALFALSWSIGEFVGYLVGAGESLEAWQ